MELQDHILDLLAGDAERVTLFACALVCRLWYNRFRVVLYKVVRLASHKQMIAFLAAAKASVNIRAFVEHILVEHSSQKLGWGHAIPLRLAHVLPNVRSIRYNCSSDSVNSLPAHPKISQLLPSLLGQFRKLRALSLDKCILRSFGDLCRLVGQARSLTELECRRVTCDIVETASVCLPDTGCRLTCARAIASNFGWALPRLWRGGRCLETADHLSSGALPAFNGLHFQEASVIAELGRISCLSPGHTNVRDGVEATVGVAQTNDSRLCTSESLHRCAFSFDNHMQG